MSGPLPIRTACYVHVPFCVRKCDYCDFFSFVRRGDEGWTYLDGLAAELEFHAAAGHLAGRLFDTLYLGGGTPTALAPEELRDLSAILRSRLSLDPAAEVTCEANPESLSREMAARLRSAGVNRLSIGAQSFHDDELTALGRPHDVAAIGAAVGAARTAGFDNLSLDLIYGLPGQTPERWRDTVEQALALEPEHLSCYCLSLERGTPLDAAVRDGRSVLPAEDRQREMFEWLLDRLPQAGLTMYEISNFARPGRRSRHNMRYWTGRPWLGLGPSAHSCLDGRRAANPAHLEEWRNRFRPPVTDDPFQDVALPDRVFERIFTALRLAEGLDLAAFAVEFGAPLSTFHPGLVERLTTEGWLHVEHGFLKLTPHAWFVSDGIFAEFAP